MSSYSPAFASSWKLWDFSSLHHPMFMVWYSTTSIGTSDSSACTGLYKFGKRGQSWLWMGSMDTYHRGDSDDCKITSLLSKTQMIRLSKTPMYGPWWIDSQKRPIRSYNAPKLAILSPFFGGRRHYSTSLQDDFQPTCLPLIIATIYGKRTPKKGLSPNPKYRTKYCATSRKIYWLKRKQLSKR